MEAHPHSITSRDLSETSVGIFRAASQRIHDAFMSEFGGSLVDEGIEAEDSKEEAEHGIPAGITEDGIELEDSQSQPQSAEITDP